MNTNYNALLEEVKKLNSERCWEECRELANVLSDVSNGTEPNSTIFTVKKANGENGNFIIEYGGFSDSYLLTSKSANACLKEIEKCFCDGVDAESFYGCLIANESDKDEDE